MRVKCTAPSKVILFGEHFVVYGVSAILCAIDKRVTAYAEIIDNKEIIIQSNFGEITIPITESISATESSFKPFVFIAKQIIEKFQHKKGIKIEIISDIPAGVGLGSSSACCAAVAGAATKLFDTIDKDEILKLAIKAEQTIFDKVSGADTTAIIHGGMIEFDSERKFKNINLDCNFNIIVINSLMKHSTADIVDIVKEFKESNGEKFSLLCQKEVEIINDAKIALRNNDLKKLGQQMKINQKHLHEIKVSNDILDEIIEIADKTAFGCKITGAGGGGCVIALVNDTNLEQTMKNLQKNNLECFIARIDNMGLDTL